MTDNMNQCVALEALLHFSSEYSESTAADQFYYLDKNTGAGLRDDTAYNSGFHKRQQLTVGNTSVNVSIRLNNYSYFQAFRNRLHPNVKMKLKITLENDNNLIFRAGGNAEKVVKTIKAA